MGCLPGRTDGRRRGLAARPRGYGALGVHFDWTRCAPTTPTPIVVEEIRRGRDGRPRHRFSWSCPRCGEWLPPFRAITVNAVERIKPAWRVRRCSFSIACHGRVSTWLPRHRLAAPQSCRAVHRCHGQAYGGGASSRSCRQVRRRSPCRFSGTMEGGSTALLEGEPLGKEVCAIAIGSAAVSPTGCPSVPFLHRDLPTPAAPATGARRASSPRLLSMDSKGCAAPGLVACGRHYGTDRRSQRGIAASRVRGAACTLLRVTHSRLRLRACRTADS